MVSIEYSDWSLLDTSTLLRPEGILRLTMALLSDSEVGETTSIPSPSAPLIRWSASSKSCLQTSSIPISRSSSIAAARPRTAPKWMVVNSNLLASSGSSSLSALRSQISELLLNPISPGFRVLTTEGEMNPTAAPYVPLSHL